jgi:hypothetical protein
MIQVIRFPDIYPRVPEDIMGNDHIEVHVGDREAVEKTIYFSTGLGGTLRSNRTRDILPISSFS